MERLTDHENEHYNQPGCNSCSDYRWRSCKESGEIDDCVQRLTWLRLLDIEDILGDDYDLDRLRELVQADREGRCVVLPQKTVFELVWKPGEYCDMICPLSIDGKGQCDFCDFGIEVVEECDCRQEHLERIEKDVFFTREAAEAALKGEQA